MRPPSRPHNEAARLLDLQEYEILDTAAEKVFDEIAELAAAICGTRYAAVTLIDLDRQWVKAAHGFSLSFGNMSRDESICGHAILESELFEAPNVARDPRFEANPALNGSPKIRYYAGCQLNSARGNAIGMLCVLDSEPGQLSESQRQSLKQLADVVMSILEAGRQSRVVNWFGGLMESVAEPIYVADPDSLHYLHANRSALHKVGLTLEELRGKSVVDLSGGSDQAQLENYVKQLRLGTASVVFEETRFNNSGGAGRVQARWQLLATGARPVLLSTEHDLAQSRP